MKRIRNMGRWVPQRVADWIHNRHRGLKFRYNWQGVYARYADVPAWGDVFEGDAWLQQNVRHAERMRSGLATVAGTLSGDEMLLPFVVASMRQRQTPLRILDFGGALGSGYLHLRQALPSDVLVDYQIVESSRICAAGRQLFRDDPQIRFFDALPPAEGEIDLVYVDSVLQYVDDYASVLEQLCAYRPLSMLFARLSAGPVPTFVTAQRNIRGASTPYWFLNIDEFVGIMNCQNYVLASAGQSVRQYDLGCFPPTHRIGRTRHLLFTATSSGGGAPHG